jgi:hypothetical protein
MSAGGERDRERREDEETAERRLAREREAAGDEERDSADGPGYTARPSGEEPEDR